MVATDEGRIKAGRILSEIGRLDDVSALEEALAVRREAARLVDAPEGPAKPTGALDDPARAHFDEDELQQFMKRPPARVSEAVEGVGRSALKGRMIRDGLWPTWAKEAGDWNPHHLLPVSQEHHPVLDALRAHGGWDHHASRNGYALPTRPDIPGAENLPVHQVTPEVFRKAGRPVPDPQTMRDLQGDPVWRARASRATTCASSWTRECLHPCRSVERICLDADPPARRRARRRILAKVEKIGKEMAEGKFKTLEIPHGWKTKWQPGMTAPIDPNVTRSGSTNSELLQAGIRPPALVVQPHPDQSAPFDCGQPDR